MVLWQYLRADLRLSYFWTRNIWAGDGNLWRRFIWAQAPGCTGEPEMIDDASFGSSHFKSCLHRPWSLTLFYKTKFYKTKFHYEMGGRQGIIPGDLRPTEKWEAWCSFCVFSLMMVMQQFCLASQKDTAPHQHAPLNLILKSANSPKDLITGWISYLMTMVVLQKIP